MDTTPRSSRRLSVGIAISLAYFIGIFFMPGFTPYYFFNCSPFGDGGTQCFGAPNLAYPIVLLIAMIGIGVAFFGLFGGSYVLSPLFIVGMLILGWGLSGLILGYIGLESCVEGRFGLAQCIAFDSEFYEPPILLGTILIGSNVLFFWKTGSHGILKEKVPFSKLSGAILASVGIILTLFSYLVIFTRYSSYAGPLTVYWVQLVAGLFFLILGVGLVTVTGSKGLGKTTRQVEMPSKQAQDS
jgi:hypothetical protein